MEEICETGRVEESIIVKLEDLDSGESLEAIVVEGKDDYYCWLNYCQHITTVKLDKGDGINERGDEIVCTNHGAMFDKSTGECTFGPCQGAYLRSVDIKYRNNKIYLDDNRYTVIETDPDRSDLPGSSTGETDF